MIKLSELQKNNTDSKIIMVALIILFLIALYFVPDDKNLRMEDNSIVTVISTLILFLIPYFLLTQVINLSFIVRFVILAAIIAFDVYFYSIGLPDIDKDIKLVVFTVFNVLVILPLIFNSND